MDGKKRFVGNYVDGNPDGEVKIFSVDGKLEEKGTYKSAVKDGNWFHYEEHGFPDQIKIYKNGVVVEKKTIENQGQ